LGKLSTWSCGQLPPVFTRREWIAYWEKTKFTNNKLKSMTGWEPDISTRKGLELFSIIADRQMQTIKFY